MKVVTAALSKFEQEKRQLLRQQLQHDTNLKHLLSHRGFRNGNIHMYMGTSGSGKSTQLRTYLEDYVVNNPINKVGVWLSEENSDDLLDEWAKVTNPSAQMLSHNIKIASEMEGMDVSSLIELKENFLKFTEDIDILFFDNITTSAMYEARNYQEKAIMQSWFKKVCLERGIPFVFFAHTDANVNDNINRLICMNDIRGPKGLVNLAQFFYIAQRFEIGNLYFPTLSIKKYRGYTVEERLYFLHYDKETSTFTKDWILPWDDFIGAFKKRNMLH